VGLSSTFSLRPSIGARVPEQKFAHLKRNVRRCVEHDVNPMEFVRLLGETIRGVANSKPNGSVGSNLLAIIVPRQSVELSEYNFITSLVPIDMRSLNGPLFFDIPKDIDRREIHFPNFVCNGMIATEGTFTASDESF